MTNTLGRLSWDAIRVKMTQTLALRSRCVRGVGALIVDSNNLIVSEGYTGPPGSLPLPPDVTHADGRVAESCVQFCPRAEKPAADRVDHEYEDCVSVHAEANAVTRADPARLRGATLYVTSPICWGCAKLIANTGIKRVVTVVDETAWYRDPMRTVEFLQNCGLDVVTQQAQK